MDYTNHRCPVCEKVFEKDDDIVVCPECGTPHHRDCYEQTMQCHFALKHSEGFDYKSEYSKEKAAEDKDTSQQANGNVGFVACENCGTFNVTGSENCSGCGKPLSKDSSSYNPFDRHTQENTSSNQSGNHNTENNQPFGGFAFDPMGGLKADTELANGVTVGEAAKFVKNNSPFYTRLFYQLKNIGQSRFSFVGFIFHGGWMLYRKMYKLGAIITAVMALLIISQLYIGTFYSDLIVKIAELYSNISIYSASDSTAALQEFLLSLDTEDLIVTVIYSVSSIGQFVVRLICGLFGNKWYYKHSIKQIENIKNQAGSKEEADAVLQTKGGVNSALATSLMVSYMILSFLPYFF